jgi:predicted nucleic acid-binding protein
MALYLLDTDAIIDWLFAIPASVAIIEDLDMRSETLCTCDIVIAEVYAGLRPAQRVAGETMLAGLTYVPTSPHAARQAGEWRYAFARQGVQLHTTDMLVAATAHEHHATLITRNVRDYPLPEITLLPLPRPER